MADERQRNHYRIDQTRDGAFVLCRATYFPDKGWMENGSKIITDIEVTRDKLKKEGFVRTYPSSFSGTGVIEYWDEPNR